MARDYADDRVHLSMVQRAVERGASRDEVIELLCHGFGYSRREAEESADDALANVANFELVIGRSR